MKTKKCLWCGEEIVITNPNTRNIKFCSVECRGKHWYENYGKQKQIDYKNKKASVPSDKKVQCKICGLWYIQMLSHAWQVHGVSAIEYKEAFGLDRKRGLIKEEYRQIKRETQDPSTIENLKKGKKFWFKKGDKTVGRYKRSQQTMDRLKQHGRYTLPHTKKK